jgi:type IV pilus assembly protein PilC
MLRDEGLRPRQRAIYEDMLRLIRQGLPISEALAAQGAFPP